MKPAVGNSLREVQPSIETLETEVQYTRVCEEAAFIHEVVVRKYNSTSLAENFMASHLSRT